MLFYSVNHLRLHKLGMRTEVMGNKIHQDLLLMDAFIVIYLVL